MIMGRWKRSSRPSPRVIGIYSAALLIMAAGAARSNKRPVMEDSGMNDYLIDMGIDPNEDTNVIDEEEYAENLEQLQARADYWTSQLSEIEEIDTTSNKKAFKKCGGLCPWLKSPYNWKPDKVDRRYTYKDAPNIVFVLVDDWGYNDPGYRSTYLSWTTPTIDRLASEGVKLDNYYAAYLCNPARSSLMTGRYPLRTGTWEPQELDAQLPLTETTLAEEMKSAGYRTYMVGKWHLGYSSIEYIPNSRGFDSFYGFYGGDMDPWNKTRTNDGWMDLQTNGRVVENLDEISSDLHTGYLFQQKVEEVMDLHNQTHSDEPMFLYYALQLVHAPWSAPQSFLDRCQEPEAAETDATASAIYNFCGMNVMLDEVLANLTCAINRLGMGDNTILILSSDNGGEMTILGNSVPYKGNKGSYWNGGVAANAFIHGKMIPESVRGSTYSGLMHITDWLPTLMGLATGGEWNGSYRGAELDGVDTWDAITTNDNSPRSEIVHYHDGTTVSLQLSDMKYISSGFGQSAHDPYFVFDEDQKPENAAMSCENPSLVTLSYAPYVVDPDVGGGGGGGGGGPGTRVREFFHRVGSGGNFSFYMVSAAVGLIAVLTAYALVVGGTAAFAGDQYKNLSNDDVLSAGDDDDSDYEYEPLTDALASAILVDDSDVSALPEAGAATVVGSHYSIVLNDEEEAKGEDRGNNIVNATSLQGNWSITQGGGGVVDTDLERQQPTLQSQTKSTYGSL